MFRGIGINVYEGVVDGDLERLARLLDRYVAVGFEVAELAAAACNVIRGGRIAPGELERVRRVLANRPLRYTLHAPCELSLIHHAEPAAEVLESCLQMAAALGAEVVVYRSAQVALHEPALGLAPLPTGAELDAMWSEETAALQRFARRAEALGVVLAVENRDPHRWEVAALARHGRPAGELATYHQGMSLRLLCEQVAQVASPNAGLCLDVGHAYLAAPYLDPPDYLGAVRACAPWVRHVHLHDNLGRLDDRSQSLPERLVFGEADNHLPPGWGRIPLREVLSLLAAGPHSPWLVMELRPRYEPYLDEALASARALASGLV
jgi:sugar phosphate isomerase/epimerase